MTHYQILGLDTSASPAEIALAYQDRASRMTPEIQSAFQVLQNPCLREQYDRSLQQKARPNIRRMAATSCREASTEGSIIGILIFAGIAALVLLVYLSGNMAFQLRDAGNQALLEGDLHTALTKHEQAVAINHRDPGYRADLARTYLALNRPQDAITQYTTALEIDPEHPQSLTGRAQVWETIGSRNLAQQDTQAARGLGIITGER